MTPKNEYKLGMLFVVLSFVFLVAVSFKMSTLGEPASTIEGSILK